MSDVNMPKLSDTMEEGTVSTWKKKSGDAVKRGDVLAEVESDKASFELEADADGVLEIIVDEGRAVPVGDLIASIGSPGQEGRGKAKPAVENAPATGATSPEPTKADDSTAEGEGGGRAQQPEGGSGNATAEPPDRVPESEPLPAEAGQPEPAAPGSPRLKASPIAARLAAELGVNLALLQGTGPEGRIIKEDVLAAAGKAGSRPGGASTAGGQGRLASPSPGRGGPEVEREELTKMQTIVARRMVQSKTTVPHFYLTTRVRMDESVRIQKQVRETVTGGEKLTVSDLVMRACALGLRRYPNVNASWADDHIEVKRQINIGFAVAQPKGLVVPVLRDVDTKDLVQISIESRQLIERARAGKPSPQDLEGGTFSISNLGMFGITEFAAVVNVPEAAILAVGAITDEAIVDSGHVAPGKMMKLTLSVDHRVLYGADGAQFLAEVRRLLENPVSLVLTPDGG